MHLTRNKGKHANNAAINITHIQRKNMRALFVSHCAAPVNKKSNTQRNRKKHLARRQTLCCDSRHWHLHIAFAISRSMPISAHTLWIIIIRLTCRLLPQPLPTVKLCNLMIFTMMKNYRKIHVFIEVLINLMNKRCCS